MKSRKILKASAGTGKTYRLSLEYIASLLLGENFQEIMVMTFTRKATGEIRERILSFLKEIVTGGDESQEILENIKKLYPDLAVDTERLSDVYSEIMKNKDRLKIHTIDSFTNIIFKKSIAPSLGIYSYEIIDDERNKEFHLKILEKLLEKKTSFEKFKDFLYENAEKDIEAYLTLIKNILGERWKFLLFNRKKRDSYDTDNLVTLLDNMKTDIEEAGKIKNPSKNIMDGFKTAFKKYLSKETETEKLKFITENFKVFLEEDTFWVKSFVNPTAKIKGTEEHVARLIEAYSIFKVQLSRFIFNSKVIPYEENLFDFVEFIFSNYDELKFREKRFTHTDISTYTFKYFNDPKLTLVKNNEVTDYFYQLTEGDIKTVFIDEFQDTSILQWKILKSIVNRANKVICVGDEKQSIYGWRGGEKELFEKLPEIIGGENETMERSYRSEKTIISFVNKLFSSIRDQYGDEDKTWNYENVKYLESKDKGFVQTVINCKDDTSSSFDAMVEMLQQNITNYSKVGIVARKNKELIAISEKLAENHIPFIINSSGSLLDHRAVKGIYSLLKYLAYGEFIYLLEFMRSDVVNIDDQQLKELITRRSEVMEYLSGIRDSIEVSKVYLGLVKGFRSKFLGSFQVNTRDGVGRLDDLALSLVRDLGILEIFPTNSDVKNLLRFYEILKEYKSIEDFVAFSEENAGGDILKQIAVEEINAVNIMSIHKSKGLEFETEFFYHQLSTKNIPYRGLKFYLKMDETYENVKDYLLTHSSYKYILKFLNMNFVEEDKLKDEMEELNNLYVAMTRPKRNLMVFIDAGIDRGKLAEKDDKILYGLKKAMGSEDNESLDMKNIGFFRETPAESIPSEVGEVSFNQELDNYRIAEDALIENKIKKKNFSYNMTLDQEFKRKRGSAVHHYLENITHLSPEELQKSQKLTLSKYGNMLGERMMANIFEGDGIKKFFENNSWIFSKEWDYIHREYKILDEKNSVRRIDRLMIKKAKDGNKGEIVIVDYKTGEKDEDQMKIYENAIRDMLKKDGIEELYDIKCHFLFLELE
ncbi:UvrD-helicase domain-containing protein [uncultured Ilyobacter sp.]|uniref:UvrD-helicase domain-containing protein n=1 Tax=uncultured Ilyobacter sp. TaxID=544433 RepID=UPI0029C74E12|nr:UvrD-helicase domain-containing protein [uncultured Ilyobacter sp.]